jgi:hypothetical protein
MPTIPVGIFCVLPPAAHAMRSFTTLLPGLVMLESRWFTPWVG